MLSGNQIAGTPCATLAVYRDLGPRCMIAYASKGSKTTGWDWRSFVLDDGIDDLICELKCELKWMLVHDLKWGSSDPMYNGALSTFWHVASPAAEDWKAGQVSLLVEMLVGLRSTQWLQVAQAEAETVHHLWLSSTHIDSSKRGRKDWQLELRTKWANECVAKSLACVTADNRTLLPRFKLTETQIPGGDQWSSSRWLHENDRM